jgi:phage baseplate assembly protein gpV
MGSQPKVLSNYSTESLQVRSDDGAQVIDVAASGITVTATQVTVTGSSVILGTATTIDGRVFLNHTHSGVQTGSGVTGKVV